MSPPSPRPPAPPARADAPADTVLDAQALARLRQLDPDGQSRLLPRVLGTYAASLTKLMAQIAQAGQAGDLGPLHMAVHTLKSSSSSVGALALADLCAQTEQAAREQRRDALPALLAQLQGEAARVDAAVQQLLAQTK